MTAKTREQIALAYRSAPWWYDVRGFFILTFAYRSTLTHQLRFFGRHFGARHLEVAVGTGTLLDLILRWRRWQGLPTVRIIGIDYAQSMLDGAKRRFARHSDVELRHADAAELPFADNTFDTANVANALHCFPDLDGALHDIFRVLKPGGTLAANVLLYPRGVWPLKQIAQRLDDWGMKKGILYRPYERQDVRERIVRTGFEIRSENLSGNCYDIVAQKPA